jgi:hypothetical protein
MALQQGSNLLIDHGIVKLADFGCGKRIGEGADDMDSAAMHTGVGTPQVRALNARAWMRCLWRGVTTLHRA